MSINDKEVCRMYQGLWLLLGGEFHGGRWFNSFYPVNHYVFAGENGYFR